MGVTAFPQKCFRLNYLFLYTIILNWPFYISKNQFSINMTYIYKRVRDIS